MEKSFNWLGDATIRYETIDSFGRYDTKPFFRDKKKQDRSTADEFFALHFMKVHCRPMITYSSSVNTFRFKHSTKT
jgi:hypothetical protein